MNNNEVIEKLSKCEEIMAIALGGSRSRGQHKLDSDYDLFCVIFDDKFESFRRSFRVLLEDIPSIRYAAEAFYLENWGYLFKAISIDNIGYDISIVSKNRISELGIRSTNIVLKDTDGLYQAYVNLADDSQFSVSKLEEQHFYDYGTLFGFEKNRFSEAVKNKDYWYAVRCIERMKNYLIRCDRIQRKIYSKSRSCPEKGYIDINNCLKKIYIIDSTLDSLVRTSEELCKLFGAIIRDEELCMRSLLLCQQ
jgi:predicted nucleotidyltransferase